MQKRTVLVCLAAAAAAMAQPPMPREYQQVLDMLGRKGDFKDGVLKVNIPRNDLKVTIGGTATPTPFGFGGWLAMSRGDGGMQVMMGDLVLTEPEVNPVLSALLEHGLEVTALHNHFYFEQPRICYMHVHGMGQAAALARQVKPALDLIGHAPAHGAPQPGAVAAGSLDTAAIAKTVGHEGEQSGPVYKITVGRPDVHLKDMGAPLNARMGLNTWAAFYGSDKAAEIAGDVAMLPAELTPVLKALRQHNLDVVAIHNHMTGTTPMIVFLHYWGKGPAQELARGFRSALDQLGSR